jgi:PIN domain nuclease of toxin-antitoxin system
MPSPFPGMDPYLEGPLWTSVHSQLAVEIARQLTPMLIPKYAALTERRLVLATPDVEDGVTISTTSLRSDAAVVTRSSREPEGGLAVATAAPLQLATVLPLPVPELTVEIRDTESLQLVTAIEVLSPWNKNGKGYEEYVEKRQKLLLSTAHLIEIDLLRAGKRVPMQDPLPAADYFILVGRASRRPVTDVWPVELHQALPGVPVPLLEGDPDVRLDLQQAVTSVYDAFGYRYLIDYSQPTKVPLPISSRDWARERLRTAGINPL